MQTAFDRQIVSTENQFAQIYVVLLKTVQHCATVSRADAVVNKEHGFDHLD